MARHLKNTQIRSGSYASRVPAAGTTVGPDVAQDGQIKYDTTTNKLVYYGDGTWNNVAQEGFAIVTKDSFTGNAVQTTFGPLSNSYEAGEEPNALVFVNTVYQNPGVNYTFNGSTNITFTSAPDNLATILILNNITSTTVG